MTTGAAARATFRDVFGVAEFRAMWLAQVLSVTGDQLARVALTVLVYGRTANRLLLDLCCGRGRRSQYFAKEM